MVTLILLVILVVINLLGCTYPIYLNNDEEFFSQEPEREEDKSFECDEIEYEYLYCALSAKYSLCSVKKRQILGESHYSRGKSSKKCRHIILKRKAARQMEYQYLFDFIKD